MRLGSFVEEPALREPLQRCARSLARALDSPRVAYGPDSALTFELTFDSILAGKSLDDVLEDARTLCGEPAHDIASIADPSGGFRNRHGYFVERIDR